MLNQTAHPNYDAELLYESLYGGTQGKILLYWSISLFSFVGPVLMFGIVIFEMFGGDSQKRTIINRLLSGGGGVPDLLLDALAAPPKINSRL